MALSKSQQSKYDFRLNPVYQVDFQKVATGKTLSSTKRRVRWRFGFSNKEALAAGKIGVDCRGEEHEICLVWSLTSGKRQVFADGTEVHFSVGNRTDTKFETSWTMPGGHIIKIIAYAKTCFTDPGCRKFDLLLDGFSFFRMPKIFELGLRRGQTIGHSRETPSNYSMPPPPETNSGDGKQRSLSMPEREVSSEEGAPRRRHESDPVDILSDTSTTSDLLEAPVQTLLDAPHQAPSTNDEFAPVQGAPLEQAFQSASAEILSLYAPATFAPVAPSVLALANESHTYLPQQQEPYGYQYQQTAYQPIHQQTYYHEAPSSGYQQQQALAYNAQPVPVSPDHSTMSVSMDEDCEGHSPVAILSMQPLDLDRMDESSGTAVSEMSEVERAMNALVNLDDISEKVVTPEQKKAQEKKSQKQPARSKPAPPKAPEWHLGQNAKLGDIHKHTPAKEAPPKEIMRTHAFDANAVHSGMLVIYGSSIPETTGFGAGAHSSHYTYAHQQQMMYAHQQQMFARQHA